MQEARAGELVLTFDGQVLEVFGWLSRNVGLGNATSLRFHVAQLQVGVDEPDRHHQRWVRLRIRGHDSAGSDFPVEEADWPDVSGLLAQVQAALST